MYGKYGTNLSCFQFMFSIRSEVRWRDDSKGRQANACVITLL